MDQSSAPADSASRPRSWVLIALLFVLAAGAASAVWVVYDASRTRTAPIQHSGADAEERVIHAGKELSVRRMEQLRDALFSYRGQFGGGQRLPSRLDELLELQLVAPDFDLRGAVSGRPIAYRPEIPADADPGLWILAHDRLLGRRRSGQGYGSSQGIIGAVVLFADGKVRWLDEKEVQQFGGLNEPAAAR